MGNHVSKTGYEVVVDQETPAAHTEAKGVVASASTKMRKPMQDIRLGYASGMLRI